MTAVTASCIQCQWHCFVQQHCTKTDPWIRWGNTVFALLVDPTSVRLQ